jgi:type II secretory pathway component PulF
LVKEIQAARTTRTLSSLLSSGVEIVTAISITSEVLQNSYYRDVLAQAESDVQKGSPLSGAFTENEHLYPILVGEMISVGEETGKLPDMLLQVAEFYESEVEQKTKDMSTIVEPFLMIIIGTFVGFFALSMISPIYSLSESI